MRLPPTAFAYYLGLGPERSYQKVAEHFGVSRQAVAKRGKKEDWGGEVRRHEEKERQHANQAASDSLAKMNERHRKTLQIVQKKALEALRTTSTMRAKEAASVLVAAIKSERAVRQDDEGPPLRVVLR